MTFDDAKKQAIGSLLHISDSGLSYVSNNYNVEIIRFFEKRSLPEPAYIDQLRKNIPYNKFLFAYTLESLVDYIFSVNRSYGQVGVENILDGAQAKAAQSVPFVHGYLSGVRLSDDGITDDFKELKRLSAIDVVGFLMRLNFK